MRAFFLVKTHPRSSNFSRSFFWYEIWLNSISWDAPFKGSVSRDWDGLYLVSKERSWEVRAARIYISSDRGVCAKIRAFYMLQRLYFAFRVRLKPFGRAAKKNNLKFYSENAGTTFAAPFRRAPHNFSRSPKSATKFFPLTEGRRTIFLALRRAPQNCAAPFGRVSAEF